MVWGKCQFLLFCLVFQNFSYELFVSSFSRNIVLTCHICSVGSDSQRLSEHQFLLKIEFNDTQPKDLPSFCLNKEINPTRKMGKIRERIGHIGLCLKGESLKPAHFAI